METRVKKERKMNPHRALIALFVCLIVVGGVTYTSHLLEQKSKTQLGQIVSIETELLKKWQQGGGLQRNLAYAAEGKEVSLLQRMLSQDVVIYPEKKVTGYFGDKTYAAVARFQAEQGLPVTGIVDLVTRDQLNAIFLSHLCPENMEGGNDLSHHKITKKEPIPLSYVPFDLVDVSRDVKSVGIACVRSSVATDLVRMFNAAKVDTVALMITSAYRKPEIQQYLFDFWIQIEGPSAIHEVALPGFSEHQLGTTIDITDASIGYAGVDDRFATSVGGKWLQKNAHLYGFIMSFPVNKESVTGFTYEPWHWRYVGVEVAEILHKSKMTFNEIDINTLQTLR